MGNGVLCRLCGKQETDHTDNPQQYTIAHHSEDLKNRSDYGSIVCDKYTPDIKNGELLCLCNKSNSREWCDGYCDFKKVTIETD